MSLSAKKIEGINLLVEWHCKKLNKRRGVSEKQKEIPSARSIEGSVCYRRIKFQ